MVGGCDLILLKHTLAANNDCRDMLYVFVYAWDEEALVHVVYDVRVDIRE